MSDHFDATAQRLGRPIAAFGCRGLKKLLIASSAVARAGLCGVTFDLFVRPSPGTPTYVGVGLMLAAATLLIVRGREKSRGVTVCRHGVLVQEQARETEYMWDEIAHVVLGRNADPAERAVAIVLIDGKRLDFAPRFWLSEDAGHRQETFVKIVRTYVRDVRRG